MKKKLALAIIVLLLMASCSTINEDPNVNTPLESYNFQNASNIKIIKDTSTGCEYFLINENTTAAVMSPYYNEKGAVSGCGEIE